MTVQEIREKFIKYFESKGHTNMPSSSLIPRDDASVLLTTAGMQQFKDWFSGKVEPEHKRVVTIQKCVRTGDIDEVGDETHLTFFEMLGNFSFGDYWKKEAIEYAWEFLTSEKWLNIGEDRIHATYFEQSKAKSGPGVIFDTDTESFEILKTIKGLKVIQSQGEDNFWTLGTPGSPGGPTVEFYVDGVEVWNLVFNEAIYKVDPYEHWHGDGVTKGVDTGMGLERLAAVINGKKSVYETNEIEDIVSYINEVNTLKNVGKKDIKAERVIADHIRAATFLIADGVRPSNTEEGYVLRKIIRRAVRYEGFDNIYDQIFCSQVGSQVIAAHKKTYPKLETERKNIKDVLDFEETKFKKTLDKGLDYIKKISIDFKAFEEEEFTGKQAFFVFETFGFPPEMYLEELKRQGVKNIKEDRFWEYFKEKFEKHQEVSRAGSEKKFAGGLESKDDPQVIKYHTAAHLMLAGLREVLGEHVHQKGSNITSERIRFDFSHDTKMTDEEKQKVEDFVNKATQEELSVSMEEMSVDEAKASGAEGEFTTKYGDKVKVYSIGGVSREICGGPHIQNTAELGHFRIKKEESSSAGVRRIKAMLE